MQSCGARVRSWPSKRPHWRRQGKDSPRSAWWMLSVQPHQPATSLLACWVRMMCPGRVTSFSAMQNVAVRLLWCLLKADCLAVQPQLTWWPSVSVTSANVVLRHSDGVRPCRHRRVCRNVGGGRCRAGAPAQRGSRVGGARRGAAGDAGGGAAAGGGRRGGARAAAVAACGPAGRARGDARPGAAGRCRLDAELC